MIVDPLKAYDTGQVTRYHANPMMNRIHQTNADHQWGVSIIALSIAPELCDRNFLICALTHDAGERAVGDLPSPFKATQPLIAAIHSEAEQSAREDVFGPDLPLSPRQRVLLKIADLAEALLCILMYHPMPEKIEGFNSTVQALSMKIGEMERVSDGEVDAWSWVDKNLNPLIAERIGSHATATPF